jgi:hypothetical protein
LRVEAREHDPLIHKTLFFIGIYLALFGFEETACVQVKKQEIKIGGPSSFCHAVVQCL